jgi:hypothetical protein
VSVLNKRQLTKWREDYTVWDNPCTGEGLRLAVHFDEKDDVKRLGGRWKPAPNGAKGGFWWMPANRLDRDCPFEDPEFWGDGGSGTVLDWLNNHKMVFGQFGVQDPSRCEQAVRFDGANPDTYRLESADIGVADVNFYAKLGICVFTVDDTSAWLTAEDGRNHWDSLVAAGYYRTVLEESA